MLLVSNVRVCLQLKVHTTTIITHVLRWGGALISLTMVTVPSSSKNHILRLEAAHTA